MLKRVVWLPCFHTLKIQDQLPNIRVPDDFVLDGKKREKLK